jgi:hypothetical protein
MPSGHCVVESVDINNDIILYCSNLVKQYSKLKNMKKVKITYTQIKNVSKTKVVGMVTITNEKYVTIQWFFMIIFF